MPGTVLRYMWDLHPLGVAMGEAGVTADLHGSSVTRHHLPPCLLLLDLWELKRNACPSSQTSRLPPRVLAVVTVTGGQNLRCLETTQIIFRVWKPWISLGFGRIVFLLEALGENPISLLTQVLKNSVAVACRARVFISLPALSRGHPWLLSAFLHTALHLRTSDGRLGSSHAWILISLCQGLLSPSSATSLVDFQPENVLSF